MIASSGHVVSFLKVVGSVPRTECSILYVFNSYLMSGVAIILH